MFPYSPTFSDASPSAGTALVTKILSPQITGLECASPGISVDHRMFLCDSPFHSTGGDPPATPLAEGPRNCGQSAAFASAAQERRRVKERICAKVARMPRRNPQRSGYEA